MFSRQRFDVDTDTGTWGDTGVPISGAIAQLAWNPTTADPAADVRVQLLAVDGDTGSGRTVYHGSSVLGAAWTRAPVVLVYDTGGDAIADRAEPPVAAGERLRVRVTPGGSPRASSSSSWPARRSPCVR